MSTLSILRGSKDGDSVKDLALARMTVAAEKLPTTVNVAQHVEAVLFRDWLRKKHLKTLDAIFKMLKLDVAGDQLFQNPMLFRIKYVGEFNKKFPNGRKNMEMLTTSFDDATLVKMVESAKNGPTTRDVAAKFQDEMLRQFLYAQTNPSYIGKLLNVKTKTDANWNVWKKYQRAYQEVHFYNMPC